jgi:hypothetical protein
MNYHYMSLMVSGKVSENVQGVSEFVQKDCLTIMERKKLYIRIFMVKKGDL